MRPPLKWVGGKAALVPYLRKHLPRTIHMYCEPFAGGAALFFELTPKHSILCDSNPHLIDFYRMVRDDPKGLIENLPGLVQHNTRDGYGEIRELFNREPHPALFWYLNKTGYSGMWRTNSAGLYNVPYGNYPNPPILDPDRIWLASVALNGVTLLAGSAFDLPDYMQLGPGDFVYLDPPYDDTFTYGTEWVHDRDQLKLFALYKRLSAAGCFVLMSNSNTERVRDLYQRHANMFEIKHTHTVRQGGPKRVTELIIRSY